MKKSKFVRVIAVLMSLTLLLGMLPASALALDENELPILPVFAIESTATTVSAVGAPTTFQWRVKGASTWNTTTTISGLYPETEYTIEYKMASTSDTVEKKVTTKTADYIANRSATTIDTAAPNVFKQTGTNLNVAFQNNFDLVYFFPSANYVDYSNARIFIQRETYNDATSSYEYSKKVVSLSSLPKDSTNRYFLDNSGIASTQLGDKIFITIYGEKDGVTYVSDVKGYSVADYCYLKLKNTSSSAKLKTMCIDVLNYGDAAQVYFNENPYNLVTDINPTLYNQYKDLATNSNPSNWSDVLKTSGTPVEADLSAISIAFEDTTKLVFKFSLSGSATKNNISVVATYESTDSSIGTVKKTYKASDIGFDGTRYFIIVDNILTSDFECPVTVQVFKDNVLISDTATANISHYCYNKYNAATSSDSFKRLVCTLMDYAYSATAYFSSN